MIDLIENGILDTDLDADGFDILNVNQINPLPPTIVPSDDPRLSDPRPVLDGSVTDASVASGAAIAQNKLNLNGVIPSVWLGNASTQAAQGDLVEYLANKGQPNGYASLDSTGKVPVTQVPSAVGAGTVTSVGLAMPPQFTVSGSPVNAAGVLTAIWNNVPDGSWFGNASGAAAPPSFQTTPLPLSLIPNLDASQITTGIFDPARLPVAVGVGLAGHAPGIVPDPGTSGSPTDYLARDMTYKPIPSLGPTYQPAVANPTFVVSAGATSTLFIKSTTLGAAIFYSTTGATSGFQAAPSNGTISGLTPGSTVWSYAARAGYNNSNVVSTTV
jgi:hypothetical protein